MSEQQPPQVSSSIKALVAEVRFLNIEQVLQKTSFGSKSSIYDLERIGQFPSRIPLWGRRVAWLESEVVEWMNSRIALRDKNNQVSK